MAVATMHIGGIRRAIEHAVEVVPPRWLNDADIVALERRYEPLLIERFADGTLLVTPPAGWSSGAGDGELTYQVFAWVHSGRFGLALGSSGGVLLPDGSLFGPDATYVSRARWATADHSRTFAEVVPDAVFELLSKSDRVRTTMKKIAAYLRNGVRLVVLIDPMTRHVYAGREGDAEPRDLGDLESLDCAPVMPGFVLDVAAIHAACRLGAEDHPSTGSG